MDGFRHSSQGMEGSHIAFRNFKRRSESSVTINCKQDGQVSSANRTIQKLSGLCFYLNILFDKVMLTGFLHFFICSKRHFSAPLFCLLGKHQLDNLKILFSGSIWDVMKFLSPFQWGLSLPSSSHWKQRVGWISQPLETPLCEFAQVQGGDSQGGSPAERGCSAGRSSERLRGFLHSFSFPWTDTMVSWAGLGQGALPFASLTLGHFSPFPGL